MDKPEVVVVDIKIPFNSMVMLMLKLVVAAVPAYLLLCLLVFLFIGLTNFIPR